MMVRRLLKQTGLLVPFFVIGMSMILAISVTLLAAQSATDTSAPATLIDFWGPDGTLAFDFVTNATTGHFQNGTGDRLNDDQIKSVYQGVSVVVTHEGVVSISLDQNRKVTVSRADINFEFFGHSGAEI